MPGFKAAKGLAFELPYDRITAYRQQAESRRQQLAAQNEAKISRISDMEKETYTNAPVYNKALESHYEELNLDMGKVIAKYGDPFKSLDGTREMKSIQTKYLDNDFLRNSAQTTEARKNLDADYKAGNRISEEDYLDYKGKYDAFIEGGDATSTFQYIRPEYEDYRDSLKEIMQRFDKTIIEETKDYTTTGYKDDQIKDGTADFWNHDIYSNARERLTNQMKATGVPVNNENLRKFTEDQIKLQFPPNKNKNYSTKTGSDKDIYSTRTPSRVRVQGSSGEQVPNSALFHYVPKDENGYLMKTEGKTQLAFGAGKDAYYTDYDGRAKVINTNGYDQSSENISTNLLITRQSYVNSIASKIRDVAVQTGIQGGIYSLGENDNGVMTAESFNALGLSLGHSQEEIAKIQKEFSDGKYVVGEKDSYNDEILIGKLEDGFSANAFLYNQMYNTSENLSSRANISTELKDDMEAMLYGSSEPTNFLLLKGVQVQGQFGPQEDVFFDAWAKEEPKAYRGQMKQIEAQGTSYYQPMKGSVVLSLDKNRHFNGVTDTQDGNYVRYRGIDQLINAEKVSSLTDYIDSRFQAELKNYKAELKREGVQNDIIGDYDNLLEMAESEDSSRTRAVLARILHLTNNNSFAPFLQAGNKLFSTKYSDITEKQDEDLTREERAIKEILLIREAL